MAETEVRTGLVGDDDRQGGTQGWANVNYPFNWVVGVPCVVTKCAANVFGNTDVEVSVFGVALKPFELLNVAVGSEPGQAGFDDVRSRIETEITDQIQDALSRANR